MVLKQWYLNTIIVVDIQSCPYDTIHVILGNLATHAQGLESCTLQDSTFLCG